MIILYVVLKSGIQILFIVVLNMNFIDMALIIDLIDGDGPYERSQKMQKVMLVW
jgi:hypothetical protein